MNNWRRYSKEILNEMSNPFYGILMDPAQVSKELATPEGAKKVASLIDNFRKSGLLQVIKKYAVRHEVPTEFLLGVLIDEQMRAFGGKPQLQKSDLGDDILSYIDPAGTSVGAAQVEPRTLYHLIVALGFRPEELSADLIRKLMVYSQKDNANSTEKYKPLSRELAYELSSILKSNPMVAVETIAKILSYHRKEWAKVKGLEDWAKTYDAWEVYAYGFSRGMEGDTGVRKGMVSPEDRVAKGLPRVPGASVRGRGIGQIAAIARDKIKNI